MDTASNDSKRPDEPAPVDLLSRPQGSGGPGPRIREARERAGLSVGEFATQLRLTVVTLRALEGDDFQTLREPVYVRGYYRKVAKLLPLSEQELIAAYDRVAAPRAAVAAMPSKLLLASSESEGRDPRALMRWLLGTVLVIALLSAMGLLFSRHERAANTPASPAAGESPAAASPGAGFPAAPADAAPKPAPPAAEGAAQPSAGAAPAPATPASPAPQAFAPVQPAPASPAPAAPANAGGGVAAATPAPASPAPAAPANAGGGALVLDFHEQSWAEVFDASGKRLLSGMMRAGAHESLVGRPPYSVFLGNAPKVDVSFSGQRIDLAGRVRDNATARFQIPLN